VSVEKTKYFIGDMLAGIYSIIRDVLNHVDVLLNNQFRAFYPEILKKIALAMRALDFSKEELLKVIEEVYNISSEAMSEEIEKSYQDAMKYAEAMKSIKPPERVIEGISERDPVKQFMIEIGVADELDRPTSAFITLAGAIRLMVKDVPEFFNNVDLINTYALQAVINVHRARAKIDEAILAELWSRVCRSMNVSSEELYNMLSELDEYIKKVYKKSISIFM